MVDNVNGLMGMRLGVFGGSFDPVHYGHLLLAETCREQCRLDEIWFVPAAIPPHKRDQSLTAAKLRVEMLQLAVGGTPAFHISTAEIDRGGVSYTVETLEQIQREHPGAELFLLMGADSLVDLPTWREPARICQLAIPLIVHRAGSPIPNLQVLEPLMAPDRLVTAQECQVTMPVIELSSSDIRGRVASGHSIRFRTPRSVEKFIETQKLYAPGS